MLSYNIKYAILNIMC